MEISSDVSTDQADAEELEELDESPEDSDDSGGENSAQDEQDEQAQQQPAEPSKQGTEAEKQSDEDADDPMADEGDYDGFFHDMSDFEDAGEEAEAEEPEGDDVGEEADAEESEEDGGQDEQEGEAETEPEGTEQAEADETPGNEATSAATPDFALWEKEDRDAILAAHPSLAPLFKGKHLAEVIDDPALFGYMRGNAAQRAKYSAVDAFEVSAKRLIANNAAKAAAKAASKQHIKSSNGKAATPPVAIPAEMKTQLRAMFPDKSWAEIEKIYKSVT